jgi:16S rRNA (adenine1518-N6/adenine1519-N6)-dimethyltransferase
VLGATEINELLERHGLAARKALGQNFVADPNMIERIVARSGVGEHDPVVEIGPGLGSLTLALADAAEQVLAIEKDPSLVPVLREVLAGRSVDNVTALEGDALSLDWSATLGARRSWHLVANLPYNVAVPIILTVLRSAPMVERLLVMVQREVAERLVATPGGRVVGIPSIKVAWFASAEIVATVPPEVFVPRPRVESALVSMRRRSSPDPAADPDEVFELVETAYRQRRKMLRSTLSKVIRPEEFAAAGVDPTTRPEQLGVAEWAALARARRSGPAR